jgi:hypothetical protein
MNPTKQNPRAAAIAAGPLATLRHHVSGAIARGEGVAIVQRPAFYELNLSNCDGLNATVHVWSDGTHELVKGTRYAMRKLIPLFRDEEAPGFVRQWIYDRLNPRKA